MAEQTGTPNPDIEESLRVLTVTLRFAQETALSLVIALLFGLVRRNILSAEDARDIVKDAISYAGRQPDIEDSELIAGVTTMLNRILENPVIKGDLPSDDHSS